jgi:hypothetical protein
VLLNLVAHDTLLAGGLVNFQEEAGLLIVVVLLDQPVPGKSVGDEVRKVGLLQARCLLVDAVEASDERIVADAHMRGFCSETVGLRQTVISRPSAGDSFWATTYLSSLVFRGLEQCQRVVSVHWGRESRGVLGGHSCGNNGALLRGRSD